jgi:hypothetical protein
MSADAVRLGLEGIDQRMAEPRPRPSPRQVHTPSSRLASTIREQSAVLSAILG